MKLSIIYGCKFEQKLLENCGNKVTKQQTIVKFFNGSTKGLVVSKCKCQTNCKC